MTPIRLDRFAQIVGGTLVGDGSTLIEGFAWDSRLAKKGDLFLAIKGENVDGHDYVANALKSGASATLAEKNVEGNHVLVPNLVEALAEYGRSIRATFDGPVIGITGSVGKTITKEFTASALSALGPVLKNPGNKNSEYTSPLVWAELHADHKGVVSEMAMRGFGQIAHLASISKPTIGLITNIGFSHVEMVGSREGIAQAKGELLEALPEGAPAVLWQGDLYLEILKRKCRGPVRTFGFTDEADCRIEQIRLIDWTSCEISGCVEGAPFETKLPAVGQHIALDAAAGLLAAVVAGAQASEAAKRLAQAELPPLRMEIVPFQNGTIVMDAYNSSPQSLGSALDTLTALPVKGRRLAVIGEMKELGEYSEASHREIGYALARAGLDKVMFYGLQTLFTMEEYLASGASPSMMGFADTLEDVAEFLKQIEVGDVVLVKGSRGLELEKTLKMIGVSK